MATYKFDSATGTYVLSDDLLLVSTDLSDYAPGSTATFTATKVAPGGAVQFTVWHSIGPGPDGIWGTIDDQLGAPLSGGDPWIVTDGGAGDLDGVVNGTITTSWYVNADAANQSFLLTADEPALGLKATTSFTDSTLVDLTFQTTRTITSGTVTAIFSSDQVTVGAGTGLLDPFSQIGGNTDQVQGYNTDFNDFLLDNAGKGGTNFIHSLKLSDLPIEFVNGVGYYRFELDINQLNAADKSLLSLNALQIWQANSATLNDYAPGATPAAGTGAFPAADNATLIYNLDAGGDKFIGLNGSLQSGSGNTTDMTMLVPISAFDTSKTFVYLYSAFGYEPGTFDYTYIDKQGEHSATSQWTNNDGFEEWNRQIGQVIDGHKFNDLNGDHVWQTATEPALNGWTVYLDFNNNNVLDPGEPSVVTGSIDLDNDGDTTDANEIGYYRFFVTPGTYTIREIPQAGWIQSAPNNAEGEFSVTLTDGQDAHNLDFGNLQTGSINGIKLLDANADGVKQAGENTPISGITINLYKDLNGDGVLQADERDGVLDNDTQDSPFKTTTTAADGTWSFNNLPPGKYIVEEVLSGGYVTKDNVDVAITLASGETHGVDAGTTFMNYKPASVNGIKLLDADADGVHDAGENTPISGITINLYKDLNGDGVLQADERDGVLDNDAQDSPFKTTTTAADGTWSFSNLDPGKYIVEEVLSGGYVTKDNVDVAITLASGETHGVDAGTTFMNYKPASVNGIKLLDADADGVHDAGENTPISGITINLY
ncbi:SdrD B-like domain-containing protein, partial [Bradyrhizobium ivorense]|uniref:SdrD B-like domain-containing protein n=1 Tax=Bradyrhizobium ivorense TaxID=2511166 RepID=UPI001AED3A91